MDKHHWLSPEAKRVVSVISTIAGFIGFVSLPEDTRAVLGIVQGKAPASLFLVASLIGFAIVYGPALFKRRHNAGVQRLIDSPAYEASFTAQIAKLRTDVGAAEEKYAVLVRKFDLNQWWWRFGEGPPDAPPLSSEHVAYVRKQIRTLENHVFKPLAEALTVVRDDLLMPVHFTEEGDFQRQVAQYFYDHTCEPVFRLLGLIRDQENEADIRPAFKLFFKKYAELRDVMQQFAMFLGRDLRTVKGYEEWRAADNKLFAEMDRLPAEKPMWAIRELVSENAKQQKGYPKPLPILFVRDA